MKNTCTNWLYSRALAVELSRGNCSAGIPLQPWKLNRTHVGFYCNDKTTARCTISQYLQMLNNLELTTQQPDPLLNGYADTITKSLFRAGFHVKIFQLLERATAWMANVRAYGLSTFDWFAKYDREACIWKTRQHSLFGGLTEYCATFPNWGIMRNGVLYPLPTLGQITYDNAFGYLPTPAAQDAKNTTLPPSQKTRDSIIGLLLREGYESGQKVNPVFYEHVMFLPLGWTDINPQKIDIKQWATDFDFAQYRNTDFFASVAPIDNAATNRNQRVKGCGNAQNPLQAVAAFLILNKLSEI